MQIKAQIKKKDYTGLICTNLVEIRLPKKFSIYEISPAPDLKQSVHARKYIGMHRGQI
jgi:hypothetical protein